MKKTIDSVALKRKIQEKIYEETRDLSQEKQIDYFHHAAENFWREIEKKREGAAARLRKP